MSPAKEHFSRDSAAYARFRPSAPEALFDWLASLCPARERAWDCGCGNGQASVMLAGRFDRVEATDISDSQLANALAHPRVTYRRMAAEEADLDPGAFDLVTVSQAAHWFDLGPFYAGVNRVLKPGGVLALWTYHLLEAGGNVDAVVRRYYGEILGTFWPPERRIVEEKYRSVPFPFAEIEAPAFTMEADWDLADLEGFMRTWSARMRYLESHGRDPLDLVSADLARAWGAAGEVRRIRWPLYMRVGRVPDRGTRKET